MIGGTRHGLWRAPFLPIGRALEEDAILAGYLAVVQPHLLQLGDIDDIGVREIGAGCRQRDRIGSAREQRLGLFDVAAEERGIFAVRISVRIWCHSQPSCCSRGQR